jgi:L-ascorbate metabolism protein UlaG (beta-lactamase superfamily)
MAGRQFGGKLTKKLRERYNASPNWQKGKFTNLTKTEVGVNFKRVPRVMYKQFKGHPNGLPKAALPILPFDKEAFLGDDFKFIWYGHSVLLLRMNGKNILIDPMFGSDASPIGPVRTKRFSENTLDLMDTLPEIDLVLFTHDHYDHLDLRSVAKLRGKVKEFYVSLGLKRHLVYWGIEEQAVTEFDWWDKADFNGVEITFTPTLHFSGRGLTSMAKCLWGGWSLISDKERIWFSGDGGYGDHFKEIGEKLGSFDFAFMECGQYCVDWKEIHMFPEESVKAAKDAGVKLAMPVHWAGFNLSYQHGWYEPAEEFLKYAGEQNLGVTIPRLGEINSLHTTKTTKWWLDT